MKEKEKKPARYYVNIKEIDGTTEIWCSEESLEKVMKIIEMKKNEGLLKQAKIYKYEGRKRVLKQVIQ